MAILRYLTKLTGLQAGDEPEVHEISLESSEPTNVGQLTARLSRALKARLTEAMTSIRLTAIFSMCSTDRGRPA